jgi:hypothetical protein
MLPLVDWPHACRSPPGKTAKARKVNARIKPCKRIRRRNGGNFVIDDKEIIGEACWRMKHLLMLFAKREGQEAEETEKQKFGTV